MNGKIDKYEEDKDEDKVGATDYHPEEAYEAIRQKDNAAAWQVPLDAEGIGPQDYKKLPDEPSGFVPEDWYGAPNQIWDTGHWSWVWGCVTLIFCVV